MPVFPILGSRPRDFEGLLFIRRYVNDKPWVIRWFLRPQGLDALSRTQRRVPGLRRLLRFMGGWMAPACPTPRPLPFAFRFVGGLWEYGIS